MRNYALLRLVTLLFLGTAALSSQSLGDVARQERQRQAANPASNRHVITNDDLKARAGSGESPSAIAENSADPFTPRASNNPNSSAAPELQVQIKDQKHKVQNLEKSIQELQAKLDERGSAGTVSSEVTILSPLNSKGATGNCPPNFPNNPYRYWCEQAFKWQAEMEK